MALSFFHIGLYNLFREVGCYHNKIFVTKKPDENKVAHCRHMGAFPLEADEGINTHKPIFYFITIFYFIWLESNGIRAYGVQKSCTPRPNTGVSRNHSNTYPLPEAPQRQAPPMTRPRFSLPTLPHLLLCSSDSNPLFFFGT